MFNTLIKNITALKQCQKGVAMIEMALVTPIIIGIILSSVDIVSYLIAQQKVSRAAYTISNLITQMDQGLTESQVSDMMLSIGEVTKPLDLSTDGKATVTAIVGIGTDGAAPDSYQVAWQRCYGAISTTPTFGSEGSTVANTDIPENMIVTTSQIIVVAEIAYNFTPILGFLTMGNRIEYTSYFRPRLGSISSIVNDAASTSTC